MRMHLHGLLALSLVVSFTGCNDSSSDKNVAKPSTYRLVLAETTDMHGQIFPYDFINATEQDRSLAHVATYAKQMQSDDDTNTSLGFLLLDNGDLLQGQPIVNLYNAKDMTTTNHIYADVMNYLNYDMSVVGNHDVEPGHDVYDNMVNQFNFPWLAANALKEGTMDPYFEPYTILKRDGIKIAVLGLTTPGVPNWLPADVYSGIEYQDMIEAAAYWVPKIRADENPDILIGVFHSGFDYTYDGYTATSASNPNAVQLIAEQVDGFDVIFFGHDHAPLQTYVNGVPVLGGGSYCNIVSEATLDMTWNETTKSYDVSVSMQEIESSTLTADADFLNTFDAAYQETINFVSSPVGTFSASVNSRDAMFKDAAFNDIVHELEFYVAKEKLNMPIDLSIAAPLQYDVSIEAGDVQFGDMWKLYKYDNLYYIMEMSGQEVVDYLEYSYKIWMNTMTNADDHLIAFQKDEGGSYILDTNGKLKTVSAYYNYDSIAGLVYDVDVSKEAGSRITVYGLDSNLDGEVDGTFDLNAMYKVGINSYRGGGGGGHLLGAGLTQDEIDGETRILAKTQTGLREYLLGWIKEQGTFAPHAIGNWKVVPEAWAASGEETSGAVLYGSNYSH